MPEFKTGPWSDDELAVLREQYPLGLSDHQIGRLLNRSDTSVESKAVSHVRRPRGLIYNGKAVTLTVSSPRRQTLFASGDARHLAEAVVNLR